MRKFRDTNTGEIITEEELRKGFEELKKKTPEEYDYSFNQYLLNCTSKNGMLIETTNENKNIENKKEIKTMKTYDEKVKAIKNIIENMDDSDAVAFHNEWCYATNNYDDEIIDMERFDEICEEMTPSDIARSIFYGDFDPNHDYFRYDGYANFESTDFPTDWIYPGDIAREVVDREESFRNDEIQEEIDSWSEDEDDEEENNGSNVTEFHCFNIEYDTDGASTEDIDLPNDLVVKINKDIRDIYGAIADAISDETGWCVLSFEYEEV